MLNYYVYFVPRRHRENGTVLELVVLCIAGKKCLIGVIWFYATSQNQTIKTMVLIIPSQNGPWKMANVEFLVAHTSHPSLTVNQGTTFLCSAQIPAKQIEFLNQCLLLDNQKPAQTCDSKHDVSMNALASGEYMSFFSTFSNKKYVDLQLKRISGSTWCRHAGKHSGR